MATRKLAIRKKGSTPSVEPSGPAEPLAVLPPETESEVFRAPVALENDGIVPETDAGQCQVSGQGLKDATVRQATYFWIQAADATGAKRTSGGDSFFVAVRGPSAVRARVLDNGDGTYLVVWKPCTSGKYDITVSHFGVTLPGSPFTVIADQRQPYAPKCEVRGDALNWAVSRNTQSFEICFRDRMGQVAHAVDLDVFVEVVGPDSPRNRQGGITAKEQRERAAAMHAQAADEQRQREFDATSIPGRRARAKAKKASANANASSRAAKEADHSAAGTAQEEAATGETDGSESRKRILRVRCEKILIVRNVPERTADVLGRLFPGQVLCHVHAHVRVHAEAWALPWPGGGPLHTSSCLLLHSTAVYCILLHSTARIATWHHDPTMILRHDPSP